MVSAKHEGAVKRLAEPLRPDHQRPVKPRNELGIIGTGDSCRDGLSQKSECTCPAPLQDHRGNVNESMIFRNREGHGVRDCSLGSSWFPLQHTGS